MKQHIWKLAIAAVVLLAVGVVVGFFVGRALLERSWSSPYATISAAEHDRSANAKADPTPPVNTKIVKAMPIRRARAAVKSLAADDAVNVLLSCEGFDDRGIELHVVVENKSKCTIKEVSGVAYGFDAFGQPSKMNWGGEHYVAFRGDFSKQPLAPGKHTTVAQRLAYVDGATNGAAHVDAYTCTDGTSWRRQ